MYDKRGTQPREQGQIRPRARRVGRMRWGGVARGGHVYRVVRAALGTLWYLSRLFFPKGFTPRLFCPKVIPLSTSVPAVSGVAVVTALLIIRMLVPFRPVPNADGSGNGSKVSPWETTRKVRLEMLPTLSFILKGF